MCEPTIGNFPYGRASGEAALESGRLCEFSRLEGIRLRSNHLPYSEKYRADVHTVVCVCDESVCVCVMSVCVCVCVRMWVCVCVCVQPRLLYLGVCPRRG